MKILPAALLLVVVLACSAPSNRQKLAEPEKGYRGMTGAILQYSEPIVKRTSDRFFELRGEVTNLSSEDLGTVWVYVRFYDNSNGYISSRKYAVENWPVGPREKTTYDYQFEYDPKISRHEIQFLDSDGAVIPSEVIPRKRNK